MPLRIAKRDALKGWTRVAYFSCPICKTRRGERFDFETIAPTWCGVIGPRQADGSLPWCTRKKTNHSKHVFCDLKAEQHVAVNWSESHPYSQSAEGAAEKRYEKVRREVKTPEQCDRLAAALAEIFSGGRRLSPFELSELTRRHFDVSEPVCEFCRHTSRGLAPRCTNRGPEFRCSLERRHRGDHIYCDGDKGEHAVAIWEQKARGRPRIVHGPVRDLTVGYDLAGSLEPCQVLGVTVDDCREPRFPPSSGRGVPPWRRGFGEAAIARDATRLAATHGGWERGW